MKITISGKQLEVTDAIKEYTEEKVSKITKYLKNITETHITLSVEHTKSEGPVHKASAQAFVPGKVINLDVESDDLYNAIDELSEKLERRVRKYKEKMQDKN